MAARTPARPLDDAPPGGTGSLHVQEELKLSAPEVPARAVFVDPTGRRHRRVVRSAWLLAGLGAAYVALVVVSLLLPPSLTRLSVPGLGPVLPGPAAAPLGQAEGEDDTPGVLLARSPSPAPAARRDTRPPSPRTERSPGARTGEPPAATAVPTPSRVPSTSAPSPAPTPARPTATGRPSSEPTQSAPPRPTEPPGQASRSPNPRPTQSRGPR